MRAAALIIALLACSAAANAQQSNDVFSHIPEVVRQLFEDIAQLSHTDMAAHKRSLLGTERSFPSVQDFFDHMFGGNWTQFLPSHWSLPSFDWDKLGSFEYSSNLQDFVDNANLTKPSSLLELHQRMEEVEAAFCTNETFVPSVKAPALCTGPTVKLAYVPKVCVLDPTQKAVVCDPAKLVLSKTPGSCVHAHHTPSAWVGKECKIAGGVGFAKNASYGGAAYAIPLKTISLDYTP